jgi:hypothetical protein
VEKDRVDLLRATFCRTAVATKTSYRGCVKPEPWLWAPWTVVLAAGIVAGFGLGAMAGEQHAPAPPDCDEPTLACATFATPQFDQAGRLWLAWSGARHVVVASSPDFGRSFSKPVLANASPLRIDTGADARPQLLFDGSRTVVVGFAIRKDDQFNGQVLVARSTDDGRTFGPPRPVSDHAASQRFLTLTASSNGRIFASWIDKRREGAAASLPESAGASIAYAWSANGGETFSPAALAHSGMCECCRLAVATTSAGLPVILFRNVVSGVRDHAIVTFAAASKPRPALPVAFDRWAIDGCPHHGPSLSVGADGVYHVAWFTDGEARQGSFYAQSRDGGRTFSAPMPMTAGGRGMRPAVGEVDGRVWLAWKEDAGHRSKVFVRMSADGGRTWSAARAIASASGTSDHPLLISHNRRMYLSWLTRAEGYRLLPLDARP